MFVSFFDIFFLFFLLFRLGGEGNIAGIKGTKKPAGTYKVPQNTVPTGRLLFFLDKKGMEQKTPSLLLDF